MDKLLAIASPLLTGGIRVVLSDLDRHLIARCLSGADGAWEDFIDRYLALITHVVNSVAKARGVEISQQSRDDCVAEILLNLVDKDFAIFRRFRGQSSLGTYLVVVSRRIAVRTLSQQGRSATREQAAPVHTSPDGRRDGQDLVENTEEVRNLLARLPGTEATAIRMFHLEHRSYGDIGAHIGIPENSVGPLLTQARQRMRSMRAE